MPMRGCGKRPVPIWDGRSSWASSRRTPVPPSTGSWASGRPLLEEEERGHHREPGGHPEELEERNPPVRRTVELGDEVRSGDVDERTGGQGQHGARDTPDGALEREGDGRPDERGERRREVVGERSLRPQTGMNQNPEVSDLLGDLVQRDGRGGRDAETGVREEGTGDDRAVHEAVDPVPEQVRERHRVEVSVRWSAERVVEGDELLEHEQAEDARDDDQGDPG